MSQENMETVRRLFEVSAATGEPSWETIDEQIEVHDHDILDADEYRGHAGYVRWLKDFLAAWSDYSVNVQELIDAGDSVVVVLVVTATGRASGATVDRQDGMVCRMGGGKVLRIDYYNSRQQALEAVGLTK